MSYRRNALCCSSVVLLIILAPTWAVAGTGVCTTPPPLPTCGQPSAPICTALPHGNCLVYLQRAAGNTVAMAINNPGANPVTAFCVAPGTWVQWIVADSTSLSFVDIQFAQGATPFSLSSLQADSSNSVVAQASGPNCYQFSLADCPSVSSTGNCGYADPRVVIMPPTLLQKRKVEHKPTPKSTQQP